MVRYFGGTKLGVPGLVNAYRTAAEDALSNAEIIQIEVKAAVSLVFPYEKTNEVQRLIAEFDVEMTDQEFTDTCKFKGRMNPDAIKELEAKLNLLGLRLEKL